MKKMVDPRFVTLRDALVGTVLTGTDGVRYHLREPIGEGGQGWVFLANYDDPEGIVVIVKVLRPDAVGEESLSRFEREAEVLRMLATRARPMPYVVRYYDHASTTLTAGGETHHLSFTVMEYVNGPTLEKVIADQRGKGLGTDRVRRIVKQVAQALDIVHAQKIVHRDLKPSNILLAADAGTEIAKVTDFGLVRLGDPSLQKTAAVAGASLGYAPPEQYEKGNKRVSPRTDVFAFGCVIFEMLSGRRAFPFEPGENPIVIVGRIVSAPRPRLAKTKRTLPFELEARDDLIEILDQELGKAMSAMPSERHETAIDLWKAIEDALLKASEPPKSFTKAVSPFERTANANDKEREALEKKPLTPAVPSPAPSNPAPEMPPRISRAPGKAKASDQPDALSAIAGWKWEQITPGIREETVRGAAWSEDGQMAVGSGPLGVARWQHGVWYAIPTVNLRPGAVRGVAFWPNGDALLFGEGGLVFRISRGGLVEPWPFGDPTVTFLGAHIDGNGAVCLVGEKGDSSSSVAIATLFVEGRLTTFTTPKVARLNGVTRIGTNGLIACGDLGTIARIESRGIEVVGSICSAKLNAIAITPTGGAFTVGAGGHALSLSSNLESTLEAVQTTQEMFALWVGDDGTAWGGSARARILRRSNSTWHRVSDLSQMHDVRAIWGTARFARAICDDGAVLEGTPISPAP